MLRVNLSEFRRNIAKYHGLAKTRAIMVTRRGLEWTVLISAAEYHRLKRRDQTAMNLDDFTAADLAALDAARAPDGAKAFDSEVPSAVRY